MTLVAGSWIHPGEACVVVQLQVIQFESLNCIALEYLVVANHDHMAVVLKKLVLKALIDALAYDLITVIQLHQLCHLQFHLYENKSHLMQKNMMLKGQPNEQQQTHGKQFDFKIHVLALDCCAIFAK